MKFNKKLILEAKINDEIMLVQYYKLDQIPIRSRLVIRKINFHENHINF